MRGILVLLGVVLAAFTVSQSTVDNFIVKKTKQVVVAYEDQWCDLFGQLLQLFADLDIEKSKLQKDGIKHIMCAVESGSNIAIVQLPKDKQKVVVQELQKVIDAMQKATAACKAYTKKVDLVLYNSKQN